MCKFSSLRYLSIFLVVLGLSFMPLLNGCAPEDPPSTECIDLDGDAICNDEDIDIDGDFVKNQSDPFPSDRFICGDSDLDGCDDCKVLGYQSPQFDGCTTPNPPVLPEVEYLAHLKDFGDKGYVSQPGTLGTEGLGRQIEAIIIRPSKGSLKLRYRAYLQDLGHTSWVYEGELCGTRDQKRRLEAFWVELVDPADKEKYSIVYTCYAQSRGWLPWSKDGQMSGTTGESRQLEDIRVMVIPK